MNQNLDIIGNDVVVIAIDGTAASGKGTLAKRLAAHLGYAYLDTGLLYRRVALTLMEKNIPADDGLAAIEAAHTLDPATLQDPALRSGEAGRGASVVAAIGGVRQALLEFQRQFPASSGKPGAVLDGRDIGTVIFPDAKRKFFVDADQAVRTQRRLKELRGKDEDVTYESVLADMRTRDARDAGRADAPMKMADDAILVDTTDLGPDDVFDFALAALDYF